MFSTDALPWSHLISPFPPPLQSVCVHGGCLWCCCHALALASLLLRNALSCNCPVSVPLLHHNKVYPKPMATSFMWASLCSSLVTLLHRLFERMICTFHAPCSQLAMPIDRAVLIANQPSYCVQSCAPGDAAGCCLFVHPLVVQAPSCEVHLKMRNVTSRCSYGVGEQGAQVQPSSAFEPAQQATHGCFAHPQTGPQAPQPAPLITPNHSPWAVTVPHRWIATGPNALGVVLRPLRGLPGHITAVWGSCSSNSSAWSSRSIRWGQLGAPPRPEGRTASSACGRGAARGSLSFAICSTATRVRRWRARSSGRASLAGRPTGRRWTRPARRPAWAAGRCRASSSGLMPSSGPVW